MDRRAVVVGAGAIGAGIGGLLAEVGVEVCLVARGAHGRAMRDRGLRLHLPDRSVVCRLPVRSSLSEVRLRADDLLLVCTMGHDVAALLPHLPVGHPVVSLQNGTGVRDQLVAAGHPTTAAVVYVPAERRAPGEVVLPGVPVPGTVWLGGWPDGPTAAADALVEPLRVAGFRARSLASVGPWVRAKTLADLAGIVVAVCDEPPPDVVRAARAEVAAAWRAAGLSYETVDALAEAVGPLSLVEVGGRPRVGGSTRHALGRGQRLETAALHQPLVALGARVGVALPVNRALLALAATAEREGWAPGTLSADRLRAMLDA